MSANDYENPVPPGVDAGRPTIARVYDALLGGADNFASDRAVVAALREVCPQISDVAVQNRRALGRGIGYLAGTLGVRQFLDLGSGLPTAENTHQVAGRSVSEARVVYVDIDPMVRAHSRSLLSGDGGTAVVVADLRDPERVLDDPGLREVIDFTQPVAIVLAGILHHLHDDENPKAIVDAYLSAAPVGSPLLITHFCSSAPDAAALEQACLSVLGTGRFRTMEEITGYFDGTTLLAPGVVYLPDFHPDTPSGRPLTTTDRLIAGGIGLKL
ncbi:SAM-dependent methyltransferase [Sphaerisporangium krabiense]|uniref:SAM-dependent methyltransferase n=1 Tax=Sphaerisporangium krabiense TaxID=763782 RepID=A0A7W9DQE9_9ACTN|nr:SAM-dependent methyltransferase [Sphaerisporangium krabiense]MBB5627441.1 hypothetical protein [Sphaerisporangium krabiense]GII64422.1 SAM-dependent methyltransferase [Sphaerisporangium krabiense]